MSEAKRCPQCQAEIPAEAPEGLCPQCLLAAALKPPTQDADSATAGFSPSATKFVPPTPEALQTALPQLEVLQLLGQGGMGAVYKARQPGLDRLVAVKILPPEISRDPAFAERFTREARSLAKLNHPNIVGVFDFGQSGGFCWFVMEYVDGVDLRQAIRAGELKPAEVLKIVPQICEALQFAHDEGIVHRDIKPENILLDRKGRVKIADFGLAKLLGLTPHDVSLTGTRQVMGTMHYMAPEQIEGTRNVDHRADIYSLGVTFYEMLTGELPIGRFAAPSKKVQIDVRLDEVVLRSLEKEPEQRYQHASEIKAEMDTIARGPSVPSADAVKAPPSQPSQRGYFIAAMICLILANLALGAFRGLNLMTLILLLWAFGFWLAWMQGGRGATASSAPRESQSATAVAQSVGLPKSLWALQLFACFLGMLAGFVPNFSYDLPFWGMDSSAVENTNFLFVAAVRPGSPPELAGLRRGDHVQGDFYELLRRLNGLKPGETQTFDVNRYGHPLQVEVTGAPPLLNGIWYADIGYPIAGAFFLCMGLLIFATASLNPIPWWRLLLAAAIGLGTAIGFFLALHGDTIFSSFVLWRSGSSPFPGSTTSFHQGFVGIAAGAFLVMLAAAEFRCRILNPGPGRLDRSTSTTAGDPAAARSEVGSKRGPNFLLTVVVPTLALSVFLLLMVGFFGHAFQARAGIRDEPRDPEISVGIVVMSTAIAFLALTCVWLYRSLPAGGFWRRTINVVGWSIACLVLGVFLWSPADQGDGYIDRELWPYRGSIESTVSLKPRFLVPDPTDYRRLVITETREIQARGRSRADARFTRHDFDVQLDLTDGQSRQIHIDALENRSFRYRKDNGTEVRGPLMDLQVALAWMNLTGDKVEKKVGNAGDKDQLTTSIDRQTQFWLDLIQSRARADEDTLPVRLDAQALASLDSYRGQTAGVPFFEPTGSEKASFEPDVPILYVGVPVMLAVWSLGMWLLLRRRAAPRPARSELA